jgi:hypothetical protein
MLGRKERISQMKRNWNEVEAMKSGAKKFSFIRSLFLLFLVLIDCCQILGVRKTFQAMNWKALVEDEVD